jgi:hypothetical protein
VYNGSILLAHYLLRRKKFSQLSSLNKDWAFFIAASLSVLPLSMRAIAVTLSSFVSWVTVVSLSPDFSTK